MISNTFRCDLGPVPSGFRTPSPPPFEPLDPASPTTVAWAAAWVHPAPQRKTRRRGPDKAKQNGATRRKRKRSALDTKKDRIEDSALSNHQPPGVPPHSGKESSLPRAAKRAKSEHVAANEEEHDRPRPHTSYHAQTEVETADAELLLLFSQTASLEASKAARNASQPTASPAAKAPRSHERHSSTSIGDRPALNGSSPQSGASRLQHDCYPSPSWPRSEKFVSAQPETVSQSALLQPPTISVEMHTDEIQTAIHEATHTAEAALHRPEDRADAAENAAVLSGSYQLAGANEQHTQEHAPTSGQLVEGVEEAAQARTPSIGPDHAKSENATQPPTSPPKPQKSPTICAGCNFHRNSLALESETYGVSWISCDGCKSWFHFACAGFKNEREVRSVDKFRCKQCKSTHGPTTYVRKSARAHSAIDYAGLNEGIVKSSDESPLHHYIKPIKDGTIKFDPENFARMRPELITRDFFEKGDGMREPIVIPAAFNPRPQPIPGSESSGPDGEEAEAPQETEDIHDTSVLHDWRGDEFEFEQVENHGQDALDMVIPLGLTVRKVSELYGPEEKIDVIDVKSQNGEDKKWTMRRWVDYYESEGNKKVRNVISLEVSQSRVGALIQRPKVVRDLDLQDSVWPAELLAKGDFPKVQFYCLMSVADCYTDFHIDFGGSSVYYHILKGKKTFFFIPPHEKHLKKYEEWCNSPAQNWTFLGDQTKECYRVDLSEGDTMLIPAGWIHAVWTPEDSLVIGGNFLTCLNLPMQIRVTQIEKATGVDRKFRYPYFQKVMWYTALHYLEDDPIPESVVELLGSGQPFKRDVPTYLDFEGWGEYSAAGAENYHSRYYSKSELDGLPELARYLERTALIAMGNITEGITTRIQEAVKRSIPKGHGDPLQTVKDFAMWYTWKRGNETIPHWAYPDFVPEGGDAAQLAEKKLSAKQMKRLDREAALQAWKIAPDRQSTRVRSQPQNLLAEMVATQNTPSTPKQNSPAPEHPSAEVNQPHEEAPTDIVPEETPPSKKSRSEGSKSWPLRRPACEPCRRGRRACKHRDVPSTNGASHQSFDGAADVPIAPTQSANGEEQGLAAGPGGQNTSPVQSNLLQMEQLEIVQQNGNIGGYISRLAGPNDNAAIVQAKSSGRSKACKDCRKSKRRCVHDEHGNEDPTKLAEAAIPRPAAKKRKPNGDPIDGASLKRAKKSQTSSPTDGEVVTGNDSEVLEATDVANAEPIDVKTSPSAVANGLSDESIPAPSATHAPNGVPELHNGEDDADAAATSPVSEIKYKIRTAEGRTEEMPNGHGPDASVLISPPESTHTDAEQEPSANVTGPDGTPPAAVRRPPHPVPAPKATPRYTPDSNAQRHTSIDGDAGSPTLSVDTAGSLRRRGSRIGSENEADEESLKLIRQLAAQDMGLRRRAKVL